MKRIRVLAVVAAVVVIASGCPLGGPVGSDPQTYTVGYDANGADSGTAPPAETKSEGVALTLSGNTGNLARDGFTFAGWNSADDGSGTSYAEGATYTTDAAVTLYAKWTYKLYEIGDTGPAGGIIFYDKGSQSDGWRYLEAWTANEGAYQWKTTQDWTNGTSVGIGAGYANTYSAMTGTEHPAAEVVRNATHGGYDDWFLPSKDELNKMYERREDVGGFVSASYLSSSENSEYDAWSQSFVNGSQLLFNKDLSVTWVRAVRAF